MVYVRNLDLALLAIALPVFVVGGLPLLGYLVGALAWLAQKGIQALVGRRAAAAGDPRTLVGLMAGSLIGRGWLVALTIFAVGLNHNDAGLAAAVLVLALVTVSLTVTLIVRPLERGNVTPPGKASS